MSGGFFRLSKIALTKLNVNDSPVSSGWFSANFSILYPGSLHIYGDRPIIPGPFSSDPPIQYHLFDFLPRN